MLIIRDRQMTALRTARLAALVEKLERVLSSLDTPDSGQQFRGRIERGLELALTYELERESDIARFLTLALRRGFPDQALPAEALTILCSYGLDPMVKLDRFEKWCDTEIMVLSLGEQFDGSRPHCSSVLPA